MMSLKVRRFEHGLMETGILENSRTEKNMAREYTFFLMALSMMERGRTAVKTVTVYSYLIMEKHMKGYSGMRYQMAMVYILIRKGECIKGNGRMG
jgi:hypothetical protein